jgi:hypothetical protein
MGLQSAHSTGPERGNLAAQEAFSADWCMKLRLRPCREW